MDKIKELDQKIEQIRFYKLVCKVLRAIIVCFLIAFILWITVSVYMLDTVNNQQQEINDLRTDVYNLELLYQNEEKNDPAVQNAPLSMSDRELIERVCQSEAGSNLIGCMAVAQVISDRANLWNMTPYQVVNQDGQFAAPTKGEISAEATQAVWAVFDEGMKAFEDNNVTHFYAEDSPEPYWIVSKEYVGSRGGNRFYESNY